MGRLTKNPEIKYAGKDNDMAVARYTLAVNRRYKRDGEQEADFISCVTFGKSAEFAQKYLHKGMRIVIGVVSALAVIRIRMERRFIPQM
ncbi:single-strand binding protein [human gut metagenome]|uniref:Single-strand binding protein n=1 Tax=human gut metagenome TaxID=408170 RepID=K1SE52_9ZZZZ